jgi:predicted deacetylase
MERAAITPKGGVKLDNVTLPASGFCPPDFTTQNQVVQAGTSGNMFHYATVTNNSQYTEGSEAFWQLHRVFRTEQARLTAPKVQQRVYEQVRQVAPRSVELVRACLDGREARKSIFSDFELGARFGVHSPNLSSAMRRYPYLTPVQVAIHQMLPKGSTIGPLRSPYGLSSTG